MNRQALCDYGLSIGIDHAYLRDWALGETVMFLHEKTDSPIGGYKRAVYFVDRGSYWIVDDYDNFFWSVNLNDSEARQVLACWLQKDFNYLKKYHDPAHKAWVDRARNRPIPEID
jgi:hypothetical protein